MRNRFYPLAPITDFQKLGTGHKKRTFVAVTEEFRILFVARLLHNNIQTSKTVKFENGQLFHTDTGTVAGRKIYFFAPSEILMEEWNRQNESDRIEEWMKDAVPQDIFAFLDCVAAERQVAQPKHRHEFMREVAKNEIRQHLQFLSLTELRRLTSIISFGKSGQAA